MQLPDWLKGVEPYGVPELSDRDSACLLLRELDYEAQLDAIRGLLTRHRDLEDARDAEIKELESHARSLTGARNDRAVDEVIGRYHESVYQDAAHSMAAVGALAPFMESVFFQAFTSCGHHIEGAPNRPNPQHERWQGAPDKRWDCHFVCHRAKYTKGIVDGIIQLSGAVGLGTRLPPDIGLTLSALFAYRNKMFHCGFEWPIQERQAFQKAMQKWPSQWFSPSTTGGNPWIFYMTGTFIQHCLDTAEGAIAGLGAFARDDLFGRKP